MEQISRERFWEELTRARAEYEAVLAQIPEDRMMEAGVQGDWSVKDVMAHVAWSEREMVGILKTGKFEGSDLWLLEQDDRNAKVYEENRGRDLEDVRDEAHQVYSELERLVERLSEDQLNDPSYFKGMPGDLTPWRILMGSTYKHYREHAEDLREWMNRR
jgi:uncharacterized damage-inducible protein DinB